eukprot:3315243-Lingulodinium_polyedra.AAC.1
MVRLSRPTAATGLRAPVGFGFCFAARHLGFGARFSERGRRQFGQVGRLHQLVVAQAGSARGR